ncbi:hypothetical protein [Mucilaginibacter gilvus]|uniref:Uncharacterized protein n=1 Tax=Mucilaginibacter gilvus TaxID=2305909 RepID=A0A444MQQ5_9SPHI|nr:hypothetical protein [Mucilaginibacter gilvus]RWY53957.1 hypothetical protein EPL05_07835 [Mucilaginibacter gilvus]
MNKLPYTFSKVIITNQSNGHKNIAFVIDNIINASMLYAVIGQSQDAYIVYRRVSDYYLDVIVTFHDLEQYIEVNYTEVEVPDFATIIDNQLITTMSLCYPLAEGQFGVLNEPIPLKYHNAQNS